MVVHNRHFWLKPFLKFLKDAEDDAVTQIRVHKIAIRFWIVNAVVATLIFIFFPDFWAQASIFYVTIVSLYANFATDYGALIASQAALSAGRAAQQVIKESDND